VKEVMVKCPLCQFENEDGTLFCENCKSDLGAAAAEVSPPAAEPALGVEPAMPVVEAVAAAVASPVEGVSETVAAPAEGILETVATAPPVAESVQEVSAPPAEAPAPVMETAAPPAAAEAEAPAAFAPQAQPKLIVMRGLKINTEYPIYEGENFIGRADEKPVDIDLEDQEPPDRIWSSRQHACIIFQEGVMSIEDLNSSNGTFVNRQRVYPGQKRQLQVNDVIQIGTVQMKVKL
jgi:hypothetical protein